jgi:hypothetical protein
VSPLPARAAAIRGDDFQHILGLFHALDLVLDPEVNSVSIEDADGGAFDDIVVRRRQGSGASTRYYQVKSSVYRNTVIDHEWLITPTSPKGKSPLQRFYKTWSELRAADDAFELHLVTNRTFDPTDPLLNLVDSKSEKLSREALAKLGRRSDAGKQLAEWARHLGAGQAELHEFLSTVFFSVVESETKYEGHVASKMRNAGLRDDADAVKLGQSMVRGWVTDGVRAITKDELFGFLVEKQLLERGAVVTFAIHAIDDVGLARPANVELDLRELYSETQPFQRRRLADPNSWESVVVPALEEAKSLIVRYSTRRVHLAAAMRLPMHFLVGRTFPKVARWDLSVDQSGTTWTTSSPETSVEVGVLADKRLSDGTEVAVAIALTTDPTDEVLEYVADLPEIGYLVTLSTPGGPHAGAVPSGDWAAGWAHAAREYVRTHHRGANRIHLFMSAPAAVALFPCVGRDLEAFALRDARLAFLQVTCHTWRKL